MFAQFSNLFQLFDFFKDEAVCLSYWEQIHWGGQPVCPHCECEKVYKTNRGYKCANKECFKKFTAISGTIFENTKIPLRLWFGAIYLMTAHKKGISSLQLGRDLGVQQRTAWYLLHRIREILKENEPEMIGGEGVVVEVDETYVGGKVKNMNNRKRREIKEQIRGVNDNKTAVMGYIERSNKIRFEVVCKECVIAEMVKENIATDSVIMTDSATTYTNIGKQFAYHGTVDHSKKEYVKEDVIHTNTIEGSFSLLDRMIIGIYHFVSPKHLQAYCNESAYRYNTRKITDPQRFEHAVKMCGNSRLTYQKLIS